MFKRIVEKRKLDAELEEDVGEIANESDSDESEHEDNEEDQSDADLDDDHKPVDIEEDAASDHGKPQIYTCDICPGKVLKNDTMIKVHVESQGHIRNMKRAKKAGMSAEEIAGRKLKNSKKRERKFERKKAEKAALIAEKQKKDDASTKKMKTDSQPSENAQRKKPSSKKTKL